VSAAQATMIQKTMVKVWGILNEVRMIFGFEGAKVQKNCVYRGFLPLSIALFLYFCGQHCETLLV